MTLPRCTRCGRDQSDTGTICHACTRDLGKTLRRIADLWPTLREAVAKQTALGARTEDKKTKRDAQPAPVNLDASRIADEARATLSGWVRILCEDRRLDPPINQVGAICAWLDRHRKDLRMHEAAGEAADEIAYACGQVVRIVDYPDDRSRVHVGPCPEQDADNEPCPGEVTAILPERDGGSPRMECGACRAEWDATQWMRLGVRIQRRQAQIEQQKEWGAA